MENVKEAIIKCLQDDDETIEQIQQFLEVNNIHLMKKEELFIKIKELIGQNRIKVVYPIQYYGVKRIDIEHIDDYWFSIR